MNSLPFLLAAQNDFPKNNLPVDGGSHWWVYVLILPLFAGAILALIAFGYGKLRVQAYFSRANVTILSLIGMCFRRVNSRVVVTGKIMAMQSGIGSELETGVTARRLEAH